MKQRFLSLLCLRQKKNDKENFAAKNMLYSRRRGGFVGSHSAQLCTKA